MIEVRLFHCPFCGSPADFRINPVPAVYCTKTSCGIEIADVTVPAAAKRWNERMEPLVECEPAWEWPSRRVSDFPKERR